jgi:hypothetical protein
MSLFVPVKLDTPEIHIWDVYLFSIALATSNVPPEPAASMEFAHVSIQFNSQLAFN